MTGRPYRLVIGLFALAGFLFGLSWATTAQAGPAFQQHFSTFAGVRGVTPHFQSLKSQSTRKSARYTYGGGPQRNDDIIDVDAEIVDTETGEKSDSTQNQRKRDRKSAQQAQGFPGGYSGYGNPQDPFNQYTQFNGQNFYGNQGFDPLDEELRIPPVIIAFLVLALLGFIFVLWTFCTFTGPLLLTLGLGAFVVRTVTNFFKRGKGDEGNYPQRRDPWA